MRLGDHERSRTTLDVAAGSFTARIELPVEAAPPIRSALRDMIVPGTATPTHNINVIDVSHHYAITVDGKLWTPGPEQSLCDQLIYVLLRASLDEEPELLHLHGGLVAQDGHGVFIAGFPMAGKSTLVTRLVEAGFSYHTDERIAIDRQLRITSLMKPISLVEGSFDLLRELDPAHTGIGAAGERIWHVPAPTSLQGGVGGPFQLETIVFIERKQGVAAEMHPVHAAEMTRLLLSDSPDAGRFGHDALEVVARLCSSVECVKLVYEHVVSAVPMIERLATLQARSVQDPDRESETLSVVEGSSYKRLAPGITGVIIDDRALLQRAEAGEIIELDEQLTVWLQLLDSDQSLEQVVHEVADANDLATSVVMELALTMLANLTKQGVLR